MTCLVKLSFILFLCMTTLYIYNREGYQNNQPPPDIPDDLQFRACHDYSNPNNLGNTNYLLRRHGVGEPQQGPYSKFLDTYHIRTYDDYFHSPICQENYQFTTTNLNGRLIPDSLDTETERNELYELERQLDERGLHNPDYLYSNPEYIQNKVLYNDHINQTFLRNHRSHDEDNLHHRLDPSLYR